MTPHSLSDYASFINTHIDHQEALAECLTKAEALIYVALRDDFLDSPETLISHYLWTLSDLIDQAKGINEKELKFSFIQQKVVK